MPSKILISLTEKGLFIPHFSGQKVTIFGNVTKNGYVYIAIFGNVTKN